MMVEANQRSRGLYRPDRRLRTRPDGEGGYLITLPRDVILKLAMAQ
jgi:hypothetical protein